MPRIFVVEDHAPLRAALTDILSREGYDVESADSAEEAIIALENGRFDLLLTDLKLPEKSGLDLIRALRSENISVPALIVTAFGTFSTAMEAGRLGVHDYIEKPFDPPALLKKISQFTAAPAPESTSTKEIVTKNAIMLDLLKHARKVASLPSSVLILGESGTGKEILAQTMHTLSPRAKNRFLAVNCGSFPESLLESELFGYEAGAFTGAATRRNGLFEECHGGSIFLDEIGCMPVSLQMKLLRTLQENEIRRVGGTRNIPIDVRVIAATNCDLENEIRSGRFREDLYYRLSVVVLQIPPLRERPEDIEPLTRAFMKRFATEFDKDGIQITPGAIKLLERHTWPGNVRELENAVQRAVIFAKGVITPQSFDLRNPFETSILPDRSLHDVASEASKKAEVKALLNVLSRTGGNKLRAARILGVSYKTLLNKVKEHDLDCYEGTSEDASQQDASAGPLMQSPPRGRIW